MKFKILIILTVIVIASVGFYAYNASKKSVDFQSPISDQKITPPQSDLISASQKTKEYKDPAGFKFSYPDDLNVSVVEKTDPSYYSSLKLTSSKSKESMTIDLTSTKYTSLEEWEKNNKQLANGSKEIKLAGLKAKEIQSKGKIMIIAVDLETLITLSAEFAEANVAYWRVVLEKVVSTFAFELPETTSNTNVSAPASSSEDDVVFEGEEVIE